MNGQQRTVLWIGLILVALNLVRHWSEVRDVIFSGAGIGAGIGSGTSPSGGGGFSIPDPLHLLPGPGSFLPPTITIPTKTTKTKNVLV
jgi:hypothetical protein